MVQHWEQRRRGSISVGANHSAHHWSWHWDYFSPVGLWTPIGGVLVTIVELWIVLSCVGDPLVPLTLAILGATLAMIGLVPGLSMRGYSGGSTSKLRNNKRVVHPAKVVVHR